MRSLIRQMVREEIAKQYDVDGDDLFNEDGKLQSGEDDPCWRDYEMVGTKMKNGREVPNCVPRNESVYRRNRNGMLNENVAKTILQQLGGRKFIAMTGAKNFVDGGSYLTFKFPRSNGINFAKIILNSMDVYEVEFYYISGGSVKLKHRIDGVYFDMLQSIFTQYTGLYTHL